eukprot:7397242-Heterocapsa_arctica.AAC.1
MFGDVQRECCAGNACEQRSCCAACHGSTRWRVAGWSMRQKSQIHIHILFKDQNRNIRSPEPRQHRERYTSAPKRTKGSTTMTITSHNVDEDGAPPPPSRQPPRDDK